jgi:hypothetical protein
MGSDAAYQLQSKAKATPTHYYGRKADGLHMVGDWTEQGGPC